MKNIGILALSLLLYPLVSRAADALTPLDVKTGLWESTVTSQSAGTLPIPAEALSRLTPEQRARIEEMMKARGQQGSKATTTKSCLTKESLQKMMTFSNDEQQNCKRTVTRSTSREQDIRLDCGRDNVLGSMTIHIEAIDSENVKGNTQVNASGGGNGGKMSSQASFTAKWLGSDCGDVKPNN